MSWEEYTALRLWIPRLECISINARTEKTFPRIDDSKHHVSIIARTRIYAQTELFASRFEAWKLAVLPLDCKDRWLRVSEFKWALSKKATNGVVIYFFELLGLQRKSMLDRPSRTTWARDGTERPRSCSETRTTMLRLTFLRWGASWLSCSRWDRCFPVRASKTKCNRYARYWAHRPAWTGRMDSNLPSSSAISSLTICLRTWTWWSKMLAMKPSSCYQTCFNTIRPSDPRPLNASSIPSFAYGYRFQSAPRRISSAPKRSLTSSWAVAPMTSIYRRSKTIKISRSPPRCQKWRSSTRRSSARRFWRQRKIVINRRLKDLQPHPSAKYRAWACLRKLGTGLAVNFLQNSRLHSNIDKTNALKPCGRKLLLGNKVITI